MSYRNRSREKAEPKPNFYSEKHWRNIVAHVNARYQQRFLAFQGNRCYIDDDLLLRYGAPPRLWYRAGGTRWHLIIRPDYEAHEQMSRHPFPLPWVLVAVDVGPKMGTEMEGYLKRNTEPLEHKLSDLPERIQSETVASMLAAVSKSLKEDPPEDEEVPF